MSRAAAAAASNVIAFRPRGTGPDHSRKAHVRLTDEARAKLADRLAALPNPGKVDYQRLAKQFGVSMRTVQNVRAEGLADDAQRGNSGRARVWPLPQDTLELIGQYRNCRVVWETLVADGRYGGSYSTFMRAVNDQVGSTTRKRVVAGTGHTSGMGRLVQGRPAFGDTYTLDIFALRAPTTVNGHLTHPYAALVREANSGVAVAHHLFATDEINAAMIASLLGTCFRGRHVPLPTDRVEAELDPVALLTAPAQASVGAGVEAQWLAALTDREDMFIGGTPDRIVCDNGSVFIAGDLDAALAGHGGIVTPTNSYASHENGAHERLHRTLRSRLLAQLPGSSDGPRDERGQLTDARSPLTLAQARTLLAHEVDAYNQRIDSRNSSPLARWFAADPEGRIMTRPAAKSLAHLAHVQDGTVQRYSQGLRLNNEHYQSPKVHEHPSKRFLVGLWYGDLDRIEVFEATGDNRWLGHATRTDAMTAADRDAVVATNTAQTATVETAIARGQALAAARFAALAPARDTDTVPDATVHPARRPQPKKRTRTGSSNADVAATRTRPGRRTGTIKVAPAADRSPQAPGPHTNHLSSDALTDALEDLPEGGDPR